MGLNTHQLRHLNNISKCHTEALGGELIYCGDCGHQQYIYRSCRNRHCPSCQGSNREEWVARQQKHLLDVPYYHVVFTLPNLLNGLCMAHPKEMYHLLFHAAWKTINTLAGDEKYLGAQTGMTSVLHTWGQNMNLHPHLHCIVPGGGVTHYGKWKLTRSNGKYLFPAKVMAIIFKGIYLKSVRDLNDQGEIDLPCGLLQKLYKKKWVVYCKKPFNKPQHVIEYLGRYTHKIAISNYRIVKVTGSSISFKWKDYRHAAKTKIMTLSISEFIRRFAMHILPHRFVRIRHYGILSNYGRSNIIPHIQEQQKYRPIVSSPTDTVPDVPECQKCKSTNVRSTLIPSFKTRGP